jgi:TolB-like protein
MSMRDFISELKRRRVFRVTGIYAIVAWIVVQVAATTFPVLLLPDWTVRFVVALFLLGLPVVVVLAWLFDITPEGIERTQQAGKPDATPPPARGRAFRRLPAWGLAVLLLAALGMSVYSYAPFDREQHATAGATSSPAGEVDRSIAVLPFADFSSGGDQEWFSDGLTEEILNALARLPDLRVASRTGSFRFKGRSDDVHTIAATLGVAHILEGSVRRTGERVRITAQLIRTADGVNLWSQNFDRDIADVIRLQEEIAFEIARTMRTALDPGALRRMVATGTNSVAAYEAYLRAQHLARSGRAIEALAAFEEARTLDPRFSDAHLRAASVWMGQMQPTLTGFGLTDLPYREKYSRAEERLAAATATATDEVRRVRSEQARAQLSLRLREAFELARQVTELVPSEQEPWIELGNVASQIGEYGVAASAFQRAAALAENEARALMNIFNRSHRVDVKGALTLAERALALDSTGLEILYQAHRVYLWAGRTPEAAALAERYRVLGGRGQQLAIVQIRQACAEGRADDAAAIHARMPDVPLRWLALTYLGRHAEAADLLRPMDEAGELYALIGYLYYPFFDPDAFPNLSAALRQQGVVRPPPPPIPYACQPALATAVSTAGRY